jgi:hypothetical protein
MALLVRAKRRRVVSDLGAENDGLLLLASDGSSTGQRK